MATDDIAPFLTPQPVPGVGFRQGTVLAWDADTADNVIEVGGSQMSNLTVLSASEVKVIQPGDQVSLLTLGTGAKSWFILGKVTVPGGAELAIVQSANYVPETSGYSVNRDGSAEFQDITARGDVTVTSLLAGTPGAARVELTPANFLRVFDASDNLVAELDATNLAVFGDNGSLVNVVPDFPDSDGNPVAAIRLRPQDPPSPHTVTNPGAAFANITTSAPVIPWLTIQSPALDGEFPALISMAGGSSDNPDSTINLSADVSVAHGMKIILDLEVTGNLTVDGFGWTNFTPKVYSGGGTTQVTGTVSYAKYRQLGKVVWAMATVTFGANAAGGAAIDLPVPAAFRSLDCGSCALFGSGVPSTQCGAAVMTSSLDKLVITSFTGGFLDATSAQNIRYSICYEAA